MQLKRHIASLSIFYLAAWIDGGQIINFGAFALVIIVVIFTSFVFDRQRDSIMNYGNQIITAIAFYIEHSVFDKFNSFFTFANLLTKFFIKQNFVFF
jgi:hypothetical protein